MLVRFALVTLLGLLALSGCRTVPPEPTTRLASAEALQSWTMDGRLGYRSGDDGGSASFHWVQADRQQGSIHFSGPLGFGSARIGWTPEHAWLEQGNDRIEAAAPGLLAWRLTGLILPIERLLYWVRGMPAPGVPVQERETGENGHLASLRQAGWLLRFDRYQPVAGLTLPHRIKASHDEQRFTLVIHSWQPRP